MQTHAYKRFLARIRPAKKKTPMPESDSEKYKAATAVAKQQ